MSGGVAVRRQAHDAAVAEQVVFPVDQERVVSEIVVPGLVVVGGDALGGVPGLPFAPLHHEARVRHLIVAARVVVVEVRVDEERDAVGVDADRGQSGAHVVAGMTLELEDPGQGPEVSDRIRLAVEMQAAVEQHRPARVLHEVAGRRHPDAAVLAGEEDPERPRLPAAVHREEAHGHRRPR